MEEINTTSSPLKSEVSSEEKGGSEVKEYPILLGAVHIAEICGCSRSSAYEIMREPGRPRWVNGKKVRLHRDLFFAQLEQESRSFMGA